MQLMHCGATILHTLIFTLALSFSADAAVFNAAEIAYNHPVDGASVSISNTVQVKPVTAGSSDPVAMHFYTDSSFSQTTGVAHIGEPLHIQVQAAACNLDANLREQYTIVLESELTGDIERLIATESGNNSGLFRLPNIPTRSGLSSPVVHGNGIVELLENDRVIATVEGCSAAASVSADVLIDPFGVVFDSQSNQTIAGATVTLIDVDGLGNGGRPQQPATVFAVDGVTPAPSTVVTGANGRFNFPRVDSSRYRLEITAPESYLFASQVPVASLPAGRTILQPGSYGGIFDVNEETGAVRLDVPLDPNVTGLFTTVSATPQVIEWGDIVAVSATGINFTGGDLSAGEMQLTLPIGFSYAAGSVLLNGVSIGEPQINGQQLTFSVGAWPNNAHQLLTFSMIAGAGAESGQVLAVSQGLDSGNTLAVSNIASTVVEITERQDQAYLIGKVFADCDGDRIQSAEEPGVAGVRLYLQNGSFVITDAEGAYSFIGLSPRTHVLRLDTLTLPEGATLAVIDGRNAGDPTSRFVDLKHNELHKANFALDACYPELLERISARRNAGEVNGSDRVRDEYLQLRSDGDSGRIQDIASSGYFRSDGSIETGAPTFRQTQRIEPENVAGQLPEVVDPQELLEQLDNQLGFVGLSDRQVLPARQASVQIKGRMGSRFFLSVNDQPIDDSKVGRRMRLPSKQLEVWEYIGLDLQSGDNRLELMVMDSFGNLRGSEVITVTTPGELYRIEWKIPESATADGQTLIDIGVRAVDENGIPVVGPVPLTVEADKGVWRSHDLDPSQAGIQLLLKHGQAELKLLPPLEPGQLNLRARSGQLIDEQSIALRAESRPLMIVGLLEAELHHQLNDGEAPNGFEQQIDSLTHEFDSQTSGAIRGSVYARGALTDRLQLTLSYDSDKDREELERDIRPQDDYALWGDSAIKGFDARSSSDLFLRLDRDASWLQYGDFNTRTDNPSTHLGRYRRSLTGVQAHGEIGNLEVTAFATQANSSQKSETLRGEGISGPYYLTALPIRNSEQLDIVVRDRDNPSEIVSERRLRRFSDYVLDEETGEILLREPLPSVSGSDLNPTFLQVQYEVDQGGDDYLITGINAELALPHGFEAAATAVIDDAPNDEYQLNSVQLSWSRRVSLVEKTTVIAEIASSDSQLLGQGLAQRVEVDHRGESLKLRIVASNSDQQFVNSSSTARTGQFDVSADVSVDLSDQTAITLDSIWRDDGLRNEQNWGALLSLSHRFESGLRGSIGTRYADGDSRTSALSTLHMAVHVPVPWVRALSVDLSAEVNVDDDQQRLLAIGSDYRLDATTRLYARHELISSLSNGFNLNSTEERNSTVVGLESTAWEGARLFSEYRARDAFSSREAEAAIGLRNRWVLGEGWRAHTSIERIESITGNTGRTTTSATLATDYTANLLWKLSARLEFRDSGVAEQWLNTLGFARKLSADWSFLGRSLLRRQTQDQQHSDEARLQLGVAWRQTHTDRWNLLSRYEYRHNQDANKTNRRHLLQTHVNWQPHRDWLISGYYGSRWNKQEGQLFEIDSGIHMAASRVRYQFTERWDIGAMLAAATDYDNRQQSHAAGLELGYLPSVNITAAVGYNFSGIEVEDLDSDTPSREGVYVKLRWKFDEHSFGGSPWKR